MTKTDKGSVDDEKVHKKAMRRYLKNKKQDLDYEWTPFRAAEKHFKVRFPPPNLQTVLDLWETSAKSAEDITGNPNAIFTKVIGTNDNRKATAYTIPEMPGSSEYSPVES